ncbi:MAG: hypothetical protein JWO96_324 [Candidatus Saccharibacteria bacterium]|nr:hypothetical protein [Candidatus Saccharibacteria bacterium]
MSVREGVMGFARQHQFLPEIGSIWTYAPDGDHSSAPMLLRVVRYGTNSGWTTIHTIRWFRKEISLRVCKSLEDEFAPKHGMRMGHFCNMIVAESLQPIGGDTDTD